MNTKKFTKALASILLAFAMIVTSVTCMTSNANAASTYTQKLTNRVLVITAKDGIYIHSEASTSTATDIAVVPNGTRLTAVSMVTVNDGGLSDTYIYVNDNNYTGYIVYNESWCYLTAAQSEDSADVANQVLYTSAVDGMYIHASASLYSTRVGSLLYGQTAQTVSKTSLWAKILFVNSSNKAQYGYVYLGDGFVTFKTVDTSIDGTKGQSAEKETKLKNATAVVMNAKGSNVHVSPSVESRKTTLLSNGTVVKALGTTPHWVHVSFIKNNVVYTGYVYRPYTSLKTGSKVTSPTPYKVKAGKSITLAISMIENVKVSCVTWTTSNTSKAVVDQFGNVTGIRKGRLTITAKMYSGRKLVRKVKYKVKVK